MRMLKNFINGDLKGEHMIKRKNLARVGVFLMLAMFLSATFQGVITTHRIAALLLMALAGFFFWVGMFFLVSSWFYITSLQKNNAQRNGIVLSAILCIIFGLASWFKPDIEADRLLMACAGFFAGVALFVPVIMESYIRTRDKEPHRN